MPELTLQVSKQKYTIHRLLPDTPIPETVTNSGFYSITQTGEELSIVCSSCITINSSKMEEGWSRIKVLGPLDFSLTGILARISGILAEVEISIFAISTFDTDYILLKSKNLAHAVTSLKNNGYNFLES